MHFLFIFICIWSALLILIKDNNILCSSDLIIGTLTWLLFLLYLNNCCNYDFIVKLLGAIEIMRYQPVLAVLTYKNLFRIIFFSIYQS